MSALFHDTSSIVKRYIPTESGAARVRRACRPETGDTILVARHTSVEVASALARQVRDNLLPPRDGERLWRAFSRHWVDQYQIVTSSDEVFRSAEDLVRRYPLRAADALQVASALTAASYSPATPVHFWTADRRQAAAAQAEGLDVELLA